jgi:hypothetical protein
LAYEKTVWVNRIVERPKTFQLQQNVDSTVTLIPQEGEVFEEGTPVTAENMNKIENELEQFETHLNDYATPHTYEDEGDDEDYIGVKYRLVFINGKPCAEVVEA